MAKRKYYSLRSFASYLGRYKLRFIVAFFSFIVADFFLVIIPVFIGKLVGVLAASPSDSHHAYIYAIILIACSSGHDLMWRLSEFLYLKLLNSVAYEYETLAFKHVIRKPYPYFVDKFTGKLSSYITTLSKEFKELMENIFWNYANAIISLITISVILTALNWQTGLIFIFGLVMMLVVGRYSIGTSAKYEKLATDIQSTKNGKIIDIIANFVNVKSFQKELSEITSIEREQAKTIKAANRSFLWSMIFWGSMSMLVRQFIWPVTILLNVYLYLHGEISLATLTTFLSSILLFSNFIWEVIWYASQFNLKLARMEEAYTHLFGSVNIAKQTSPERPVRALQFTSNFQLHDLSFAYPDKADESVLSKLTINIKKGQKIGIVGKSGSGKTTLTKLLLGYYPVASGQLLLDGQEVDNRDLARLISYVPQDTSLFHRSVADNIAYATDKIVTQEDIVTAAKQAHAHEFIAKISDTYDALVGERGVKLSAGQRQRIAIARAFLDDKPLLILDEATSALDSESEILVQQALEVLWKDKTVLAIAHRLSTLRHMDTILVLDNGTIAEQGSHQELLDQKGLYAQLWEHQSGGFLEE
jgi:ABC-type multidrug transport system fused ATPase/permease subunit